MTELSDQERAYRVYVDEFERSIANGKVLGKRVPDTFEEWKSFGMAEENAGPL